MCIRDRLIVIYLGKLLITLVNKYAPEEVIPAKKEALQGPAPVSYTHLFGKFGKVECLVAYRPGEPFAGIQAFFLLVLILSLIHILNIKRTAETTDTFLFENSRTTIFTFHSYITD